MKSNINNLVSGRHDLYFFVVLILFSLFSWFIHDLSQGKVEERGFIIRIIGDGGEDRISLKDKRNERVDVKGRIGKMIIEIDGKGRVRVASSSCPCQTCVNMGWSSSLSVICVPGGIVVEPESMNEKFDAVTR